MPRLTARDTGKLGEDHAEAFLKSRGLRITARNYRIPAGEIDIIAESLEYIIFVEVRTRAQGGMTAPAETVTRKKQRKILKAAQAYLAEYPTLLQPRFDVCAVFTKNGRVMYVEQIENAF